MIALMYHDIVAASAQTTSGFQSADANFYKIAPETFARHLALLRASGADALLTFDDAGVSAVHPCADMCDEVGVRAVFFVPTALIGSKGFCTRSDIADLHHRGHVIGSHSATHPVPISSLKDEALMAEWRTSKDELEAITGERVRIASVPGGFTSARVEAAVAKAGYSELFTSTPTRQSRNVSGLQVYGRFSVTRRTSDATLAAVLDNSPIPWIHEQMGWKAKGLFKAVGGRAWLSFRRWYFASRGRDQ